MSDEPLAPGASHESIHVLVNRVLGELPAIGKDSYNQQQKFHFRGVDAVLNALNPLLAKHGVTPVPHAVKERVPAVRQTKSGGLMYEVNLHVQFRLYGPAGDFIEAEAWGEGTDSGDKATGKAHTAAQKAMLIQVFNVSTQEQTENESDNFSPEETVAGPPVFSCPMDCGTEPKVPSDMEDHLLGRHGWVLDEKTGRARRPTPAESGMHAPPPAAVAAGAPQFADGEEPF